MSQFMDLFYMLISSCLSTPSSIILNQIVKIILIPLSPLAQIKLIKLSFYFRSLIDKQLRRLKIVFNFQLGRSMDHIKAIFTDSQKLPSQVSKKKKGSLPLMGGLDYCYRYRPMADQNTFKQELEHTEGQVAEYFPQGLADQYRSYLNTTKYMTAAFWVVTLSFAGFCHKINIISRLLGQKTWKMFGFKLTSLVLPFVGMDLIMPTAESQELNLLWEGMQERYKRYKYSGDIIELNKSVILVGEGLYEDASQPK